MVLTYKLILLTSCVNVYIVPLPVDFQHKKATIFGGFIIFGEKAHSSWCCYVVSLAPSTHIFLGYFTKYCLRSYKCVHHRLISKYTDLWLSLRWHPLSHMQHSYHGWPTFLTVNIFSTYGYYTQNVCCFSARIIWMSFLCILPSTADTTSVFAVFVKSTQS